MAMQEQEERALWQRAQSGDRQALDEVLRLHEKSIYRFGLRLCGDEDAAREVLQRTMLAAFEQLGTFRGEARISTWLYALARSACSRLHRRTRSAPLHDVALDAGSPPELVAEGPSPEERFDAAQLSEVVAVAISMLPDTYREVIVLRDVEDLAAEEVVQITGLKLPALKSRLHRGRQLLRSHLVTLLRESEGRVAGARACPQLAERLARIEPGEVDHAACKAIESHLENCDACAESLGSLRDAAALCRRLPSGNVPAPVQSAVRNAIIEVLDA